MWVRFWKRTSALPPKHLDSEWPLRSSMESRKTNSRLSEGGQKEGGLHLGAGKRKGAPVRWSHRRSVRSGSRSWPYLHDEAWPPCGGQDSCAGGGTVFACHSTAARR